MLSPSEISLGDALRAFDVHAEESIADSISSFSPSRILVGGTSSLCLVENDVSKAHRTANILVTRDGHVTVTAPFGTFEKIVISAANATGLWIPATEIYDFASVAETVDAVLDFRAEDAESGVPGFRLHEYWSDSLVDLLACCVMSVMRVMRKDVSAIDVSAAGKVKFFKYDRVWPVEAWRGAVNAMSVLPMFPDKSNPNYVVQPNDTVESIAARLLGNANRAMEIAELNGGFRALRPGEYLRMPESALVETTTGDLSAPPPQDAIAEFSPLQCVSKLPILKVGDQSIHVRILRALLDTHGFASGSLSDRWAPTDDLNRAIFYYRKNKNLPHVDFWGQKDWESLISSDPLPPVVDNQDPFLIKTAKALMVLAGENPGAIDATCGEEMRRAVESFQMSRGIEADGVISNSNGTWAWLLALVH